MQDLPRKSATSLLGTTPATLFTNENISLDQSAQILTGQKLRSTHKRQMWTDLANIGRHWSNWLRLSRVHPQLAKGAPKLAEFSRNWSKSGRQWEKTLATDRCRLKLGCVHPKLAENARKLT